MGITPSSSREDSSSFSIPWWQNKITVPTSQADLRRIKTKESRYKDKKLKTEAPCVRIVAASIFMERKNGKKNLFKKI